MLAPYNKQFTIIQGEISQKIVQKFGSVSSIRTFSLLRTTVSCQPIHPHKTSPPFGNETESFFPFSVMLF